MMSFFDTTHSKIVSSKLQEQQPVLPLLPQEEKKEKKEKINSSKSNNHQHMVTSSVLDDSVHSQVTNATAIDFEDDYSDDEDVTTTPNCIDKASPLTITTDIVVKGNITNAARSSLPRVHFGSITIREYYFELGTGNVPCHSGGGPPIGLSWDWSKEYICQSLDKYEESKKHQCARSQTQRQQKLVPLPSQQRTAILLNEGYTMREIIVATKECRTMRHNRIKSVSKARRKNWMNPFITLKKLGIYKRKF